MTTLAIVYHSGFGHAAALADHVAKGAASVGGVSVKTYKAEELASPDKVIHPHGSGPTRSMDVFLEEDWNGEEKPQAGRDRLEAPAG